MPNYFIYMKLWKRQNYGKRNHTGDFQGLGYLERTDCKEARWGKRRLLSLMKVKVLVAQLCLTLCNPMDCSHGIPQARVLEWVAIHSLLQGLFPTQGSNASLPHFRQILYLLSHQENLFLEPPLRCEGAQAAITQHHQPSAL